VAVGAGSIWVSDNADQAVLEVNPRSNRITHAIHLGSRPEGIAFADGTIWVATQ
jgi:hypothetical protein